MSQSVQENLQVTLHSQKDLPYKYDLLMHFLLWQVLHIEVFWNNTKPWEKAKPLILNIHTVWPLFKKVVRPMFDEWIKFSCNRYYKDLFFLSMHHVSCLGRHTSLVFHYHCIICRCILKVVTIKTFKYLCVFNSVMKITKPRVR